MEDNMRNLTKFLAVFAGAVLVAAGAAPVGAATERSEDGGTALSPENEREIIEIFQERGVAEEHWDDLLHTLAASELTDADKGVEPLYEEPYTHHSGGAGTRKVFEDGSVSVVYVARDPESVERLVPVSPDDDQSEASLEHNVEPFATGVSNCLPRGSSGIWIRTNGCEAWYGGISFDYSFKVDIRTQINHNSQIIRAYGAQVVRAIGHTASGMRTTVVRAQQSGSTPAHARMSFELSNNYTGSLRTIQLNFWISNYSVSATTNL